jgi:hypothetical protein
MESLGQGKSRPDISPATVTWRPVSWLPYFSIAMR